MNITEQNKTVVTRFNKEFIEQGNTAAFHELVADDCINRTAEPGAPNGKDGMFHFLNDMLRAGFPDITVTILDQVAEGDKVTTRKVFNGTHTGAFLGVPATGRKVAIEVIDIIRLQDGRYKEHWGLSNIPAVMALLMA